jgi:hypothetical protein
MVGSGEDLICRDGRERRCTSSLSNVMIVKIAKPDFNTTIGHKVSNAYTSCVCFIDKSKQNSVQSRGVYRLKFSRKRISKAFAQFSKMTMASRGTGHLGAIG